MGILLQEGDDITFQPLDWIGASVGVPEHQGVAIWSQSGSIELDTHRHERSVRLLRPCDACQVSRTLVATVTLT